MKNLWLAVLCTLAVVSEARAEGFDYSAGLGARNMPFGAALFGEVGYGQLLWGEKKEGQVMYGYARPIVRGRTSGFVNRAEMALEVFPISFLGFGGGFAYTSRNTDLATLDCTVVACTGGISRAYFETSLLLGHAGFFLGGSSRYNQLTPTVTDRSFGEETSNLAGSAGGDRLVSNEAFAGYSFSENWKAGVQWFGDHMISSGTTNSQESVFVEHRRDAWRFTVGLGMYESTTQLPAFTGYFLVKWTGIPSVGLR